MRDVDGREQFVEIVDFCAITIQRALDACIDVLGHGTQIDRVEFIGMLNAGIDRVTALPLSRIDEVMEEINELQRDNNILPRLNQPTANFTPHEPFVSTVDEEGDLQQTLRWTRR